VVLPPKQTALKEPPLKRRRQDPQSESEEEVVEVQPKKRSGKKKEKEEKSEKVEEQDREKVEKQDREKVEKHKQKNRVLKQRVIELEKEVKEKDKLISDSNIKLAQSLGGQATQQEKAKRKEWKDKYNALLEQHHELKVEVAVLKTKLDINK
jgi:hypothetical protein